MNINVNTVVENLAELLSNSTDMASVFYDIFLNPVPMDVTLHQFNDENVIEEITIPNRAKDRKIALDGVGTPEGRVQANVGACYVDTASSLVYFKVTGTGVNGWVEVLTADVLDDILSNFQPTISTSGTNVVLLNKQGEITSSADIGNISANKSLSNLNVEGNNVINGKASVNLDNLSSTGEARFTQIQTALAGKASTDLHNITEDGVSVIEEIAKRYGGADLSLSNLSGSGNAKFQYAPFSVNSGLTLDGDNATLQTASSLAPVERVVVPVMSSNSEQGVTVSVSGNTGSEYAPYYITNQGTYIWYSAYGAGGTAVFTMVLAESIPQGAVCDITLTGSTWYQEIDQGYLAHIRGGCLNPQITFIYTDDTQEVVWTDAGIQLSGTTTWTPQVLASKAVKQIILRASSPAAQTAGDACWLQMGNFTLKATYVQGAGSASVITRYVVPELSSNSSDYGTCNNYQLTSTYVLYTSSFIMELAQDNYIPADAIVSFTATERGYKTRNETGWDYFGASGLTITYKYIDNTTELAYTKSNWNNNDYTAPVTISGQISPPTKTVIGIVATATKFSPGQYHTSTLNWGFFNLTAEYTVSSNSTLICAPCVMTTADSRTKIFTAYNVLDCSNMSDGTYQIFRSYADGSLSIAPSVSVSRELITGSDGKVWLDNSQYPLNVKQYTSGAWQLNNDIVWLGNAVVSSGVITSVTNRYFNACPAIRVLVCSYQNGSSWYSIYSDGWCEQWGISNATQSGVTVNLLKPFKSTDYKVFGAHLHGSAYSYYYAGADIVSKSQFKLYSNSTGTSNYAWYACGYIE